MNKRNVANSRRGVDNILKILGQKPQVVRGNLLNIVDSIQSNKAAFLQLARTHETPFYVFDQMQLRQNLKNFRAAFTKIPRCTPYYAMKANHYEPIVREAVRQGFGIEASSGREVEIALKAGAKSILFSGPGKTEKELLVSCAHSDRVMINIDSFSELKRLGTLVQKIKRHMRVGVRITGSVHGTWTKFGIPLNELRRFWLAAKKYRFLSLEGIQFHMSWNTTPRPYETMFRELAEYLHTHFSKALLREIQYIDFGGGFYPSLAEGYYPWAAHYPGTLPAGKLLKIANDYYKEPTNFTDPYYITKATDITTFAEAIGACIKKYFAPLLECNYFTEPGRIICNDVMHIVVRVIDVKKSEHVITDGGVNVVGWEYGEFFYWPLINLTHPARTEMPCTFYGSLCTPHDIWGYYCYAKKINEGDIIVVPNQGAYKYVLAQNFIKPFPTVYSLGSVHRPTK